MPNTLPLIVCFLLLLPFSGGAAENRAAGFLLQFSLQESTAAILQKMGQPAHVVDGNAHRLWEFVEKPGDVEVGEYPWTFYFEQPSLSLLSVTANLEEGMNVDELFKQGRYFHYPSADKPTLTVRVRELPGDRVLLAIGAGRAGDFCHQLILLRRSALGRFYPWIHL